MVRNEKSTFTAQFSSSRINKMYELLNRFSDKLTKQNQDREIAAAALRYKALIAGSQQWAVPSKVYSHFAKKFELNLEGFASPFNTQILISNDQKERKFCSIFPEDSSFGSIGNFFDANLEDYRSIINPPFVESLIEAVAAKLDNTLKLIKPTTLICVVVPSWKDAVFYKHLNRLLTAYSGKRIILTPSDKYYYEDNAFDSSTTKMIPARFESTWFCFGSDASKITKADLL